MPNTSMLDQTTEFLLYTAPNGAIEVEVQRTTITKHLKTTLESNGLQENVLCSILKHSIGHGTIEEKIKEYANG